jgi:hypothetical protein
MTTNRGEGKMERITIVMPKQADGELVELTEYLTETVFKGEWQGGGLLGGEFGYGVEYENDTFMMHPFCWCGQDDCKWCGKKNFPNFLYKPTGGKVWWYKWIGRSEEVKGKFDKDWLQKCKDSVKEQL